MKEFFSLRLKLGALLSVTALSSGCAIVRAPEGSSGSLADYGKMVHHYHLTHRAVRVFDHQTGKYLGTMVVQNDRLGIFEKR